MGKKKKDTTLSLTEKVLLRKETEHAELEKRAVRTNNKLVKLLKQKIKAASAALVTRGDEQSIETIWVVDPHNVCVEIEDFTVLEATATFDNKLQAAFGFPLTIASGEVYLVPDLQTLVIPYDEGPPFDIDSVDSFIARPAEDIIAALAISTIERFGVSSQTPFAPELDLLFKWLDELAATEPVVTAKKKTSKNKK